MSERPPTQTTDLTPQMSRLIRRLLGKELLLLEDDERNPHFVLVEETLDWLDHAPVRSTP